MSAFGLLCEAARRCVWATLSTCDPNGGVVVVLGPVRRVFLFTAAVKAAEAIAVLGKNPYGYEYQPRLTSHSTEKQGSRDSDPQRSRYSGRHIGVESRDSLGSAKRVFGE